MKPTTACTLAIVTAALPMHAAVTIGFEDLNVPAAGYYNGSDGSGGFFSGGAAFPNDYDTQWMSWQGFAYSTLTDNTISDADMEAHTFTGYQFQSVPGGAATGQVYAIGYVGWATQPTIALPAGLDTPVSIKVANDLYAYASFLHGDAFSNGVVGDDSDFFSLTVEGFDSTGTSTGTVVVLLEAFFEAPVPPVAASTQWLPVDLSALGTGVRSIAFSLDSSDTGDWGMNTPAYFCIDDLAMDASGGFWAGAPIQEGGWAVTAALGPVWTPAPDSSWVWSDRLGTWVYANEQSRAQMADGEGNWLYISR